LKYVVCMCRCEPGLVSFENVGMLNEYCLDHLLNVPTFDGTTISFKGKAVESLERKIRNEIYI